MGNAPWKEGMQFFAENLGTVDPDGNTSARMQARSGEERAG